MTHWMCGSCGYYVCESEPPNKCPGCNQLCVFRNVTCYRPECGGEANVDPLLVGAALGTLSKPVQPKIEGALTNVESFPQGQIMNGLSDSQKRKLMSLGHAENYEEGQFICTAGSESRKLYFVEDGEVMIEIEYGKGMFIPVSIVTPNQAFGCSALVLPNRHTSTAMALSKTRTTTFERDDLLALMKDDPSLGVILMRNVASIIESRLTSLKVELIGVLRGSQSAPDLFHLHL